MAYIRIKGLAWHFNIVIWIIATSSPLLFGYLILLTYSRRQIIFDKTTRTLYRKTFWKPKALLPFEEMGQIRKSNLFGVTYKITTKQDPFGRGHAISPNLSNNFSANTKIREFEQQILPVIKAMITPYTLTSHSENDQNSYTKGIFNFYHPHSLGYQLSTPSKWILPTVFLIFLMGIMWYRFLYWKITIHSFDDVIPLVAPLIPILIGLTMSTRKVIFDIKHRSIKVFYFGYPFKIYSFDDFTKFTIVESYTNAMYSGTYLRIRFKNDEELNLYGSKNTVQLKTLQEETKFILDMTLWCKNCLPS